MMPASRAFWSLGTVSLLLLGAVVVPWMAWLAVVLDVCILAAVAIDSRRAARVELSASRALPPLLVQGAHAEVSVSFLARAERALTIWVRDGLTSALRHRSPRALLRLPAGGAGQWTYEILPRRRGEQSIGPLTARVLGPWGLAWAQRELAAPIAERVYPQIRWEGEVGRLLALARRRELGKMPRRIRATGSETYALRDYLRGDPPNKIHWKSTARHGHLVTREESWEQGVRLLILLDAARTMASTAEAATEAAVRSRSKLDHALSTSLALTRVAAGRGDRVTLIAFSDRIERVARVRPDARGIRLAYQSLFDLPARLAEPAYDVAVAEALRLETRRATVVLFTSVVDLAAAELLQQSMRRLERRHRPLLINLEDPELNQLALGASQSPAEAFAKVASLEILLENRRLARRLRHEGVRVVTTPANRLTLESLEAYLSLFRGREGSI